MNIELDECKTDHVIYALESSIEDLKLQIESCEDMNLAEVLNGTMSDLSNLITELHSKQISDSINTETITTDM